MSENLKSRNYNKTTNERKKLLNNASTGTKLAELYGRNELVHNRECLSKERYLHNQKKAAETCNNVKKARREAYFHCKPIRFECKGRLSKSYPATYQNDTRFKMNNEIRILNERTQRAVPKEVRGPPIKSSIDPPRITRTNSFHSYSTQISQPTKDSHELKQNPNLDKTFTDVVLPEKDYSKYHSNPKWNVSCENNYYSSQHLKIPSSGSKTYPQKLYTQSNQSGFPVSLATSDIIQTGTDQYEQFQTQRRLPTTKDFIRPYETTVAVYSVQNPGTQYTPKKRKKDTIYCGSNNAFRLQFYKSMSDGRCSSKNGFSFKQGDEGPMRKNCPGYGRPMARNGPGCRGGAGRPISIDGPAYIRSDRPPICKNGMILIPKGYSVTRLRRDEDGCICTDIPDADYGFGDFQTRNKSFLKRYFQVLMRENKRCVCGRSRKRHVCPPPTCKRNVMNQGCQCKCNNIGKTGFGNDAACQCKNKEKGEPRPDRESFFTERGLTCCVPITPTECSRCSFEHKIHPSSKRQEETARRTVNIGSNFSFKLGFYKGTKYKQCLPNPDDSCCVQIPACGEPDLNNPCCVSVPPECCSYSSECNHPILKQFTQSLDGSCSPCPTPCYEPCPSKNKAVGCSNSKRALLESLIQNSDAASCCEKPILVECTNHMKNEKCGPNCGPEGERKKMKSKFCRIKNRACHCDIKSIRIKCTNKEGGVEISCSKCKRPKKTNEDDGYCCCDEKQKSPSNDIQPPSNDIQPPSNDIQPPSNDIQPPSKSILGILSKTTERFRKKEKKEKPPLLTKEAQCSCSYHNKIEGEFDYRCLLKNMASSGRKLKRQCACKNESNYKKTFSRLLLYNIQDKACCSSETCGFEDSNTPLYKNVGIGDVDLRKPPCLRKPCPNKKGQTNLRFKKIFYSLIKNETCCIKQKRMFDPLNQSEAAVQHVGSNDHNERLGREVVYRDQGSYAPRDKPITLKDYETNPAYAPAEPVDPNQNTIRIGSSCSFCVELYRGPPPAKTARANAPSGDCPPCIPCPPTSSVQQQWAPSNYGQPCEECANPTNDALLIAQKAFAHLILRKKKRLANKTTTTCQKCNKCVKVPLIKRGFAQMVLQDAKQRRATRTCQKTNTISPLHKVVKRRPGGTGKGKTNCDPYVCLKRINQGNCCNKR